MPSISKVELKDKKNQATEFDKEDIRKPSAFECVAASFRKLSAEKQIEDAVIYFWESHGGKNDCDDKEKIQATVDLIIKKFNLASCEKYEVRAGYLSRYNYLSKPINEASHSEIKDAIEQGEAEENRWLKRYGEYIKPLGFIEKNWQECIDKENNPYFDSCKELIEEKLESNETFCDAFSKTIDDYVAKHSTDKTNGKLYVVEENTWILSLPLLHLHKPIYLIHIGNDNSAIRTLFNQFPNLQIAVKWLSPHFCKKTFINTVDFQLEYRNKHDFGYSCAADNKEIAGTVDQLKKNESLTKETLLRFLEHERAEKDLLSNIIRKMPGHVYWLNRDNVYLGCNELQAEHFNLKSPSEVIGKTNYDLPVSEEADKLNKINKIVMETGVPYQGEEPATMHNGFGYYLSNKIPLFDGYGKIIGLLGSSIDITDSKKAEAQQLEIERQKSQIEEHKKFKEIVDQVVHDIRTPLASIMMQLRSNAEEIPEKVRIGLNESATNAIDIANDLLDRYKKDKQNIDFAEEQRPAMISMMLSQVLSAKRYQYKDQSVKFIDEFCPGSAFVFVKVQPSHFMRMISNLINNSVEAFEGKKGTVCLGINLNEGNVVITIQDNGKGMPKEVIDKILNGEVVATDKKDGHGIGLTQIRETIKYNHGVFDVKSILGEGTKMILTFPIAEQPDWIAKNIKLNKSDTVVILDDDSSIHSAWDSCFKDYIDDIHIQHFTFGNDAVYFIDTFPEKDKIFLLTDQELLKQDITGIDVIKKTNIKRAILVTSHYAEEKVYNLVIENGIKLLPKQLASEIPIEICEATPESPLTR